jgi:hypothetical protein
MVKKTLASPRQPVQLHAPSKRVQPRPPAILDPIMLDIGCGPNKAPGYIGCDQYAFAGVDHVFNIGRERWPFADGSVEGARSSHFIEHLNQEERCHFANELGRVLKIGGKCEFACPHWASNRAYGDPTHQWPPVSEMWFYYLKRDWRLSQAPHTDAAHLPWGLTCDLECTWGYSIHATVQQKGQDFQQFALTFYKEAAQDTIGVLTRLS